MHRAADRVSTSHPQELLRNVKGDSDYVFRLASLKHFISMRRTTNASTYLIAPCQPGRSTQ